MSSASASASTSASPSPPHLPSHISPQAIPNAGKCLVTSKAIPPGSLVFQIRRPLALALDAPRLRETCEGCLQWVNGGHMGIKEGGYGNDDDGNVATPSGRAVEDTSRLRDCMGCKVVRYCGKTCQAQAWKTHHKHECKIFKFLYPNILPNTVRLLMQLLLRRKAGTIDEAEWSAFMSLESHLDQFKAQNTTETEKEKNHDGLTTWQVIELMSESARSYSRSGESLGFVQGMAARVLINTHTLTAPSLDPLGICLSPTSALLNHSCDPNTSIGFSQNGTLSLRSLRAIPASSPLTISYIDSILPTAVRQSELTSRYHFTCTCPLCLAKCTSSLSNPDPPSTPQHETLLPEPLRLLEEALSTSESNPSLSLRQLKRANSLFTPHNTTYPPHRYPRPLIHSQTLLTALNLANWSLAFRHSLVVYFYIDPIHYVPRWHPVRVVHTWVALRLAMQLANPDLPDDEGSTSNASSSVASSATTPEWRQSIDWAVVVWCLWREVSEDVIKSHGADSTFALEVKAFGRGSALFEMLVPPGEKEREWVRLRGLAEEVLG